eukprot:1994381-Pleurochrysis_carterae.AAC.3
MLRSSAESSSCGSPHSLGGASLHWKHCAAHSTQPGASANEMILPWNLPEIERTVSRLAEPTPPPPNPPSLPVSASPCSSPLNTFTEPSQILALPQIPAARARARSNLVKLQKVGAPPVPRKAREQVRHPQLGLHLPL